MTTYIIIPEKYALKFSPSSFRRDNQNVKC